MMITVCSKNVVVRFSSPQVLCSPARGRCLGGWRRHQEVNNSLVQYIKSPVSSSFNTYLVLQISCIKDGCKIWSKCHTFDIMIAIMIYGKWE